MFASSKYSTPICFVVEVLDTKDKWNQKTSFQHLEITAVLREAMASLSEAALLLFFLKITNSPFNQSYFMKWATVDLGETVRQGRGWKRGPGQGSCGLLKNKV